MPASNPSNDDVARLLATTVNQGLHPVRFHRYAERFFDGVPLRGRTALDIGGGSGLLSFYAALHGAKVRCIEPGAAGAVPGRNVLFQEYASMFPDADVTLDTSTIQELAGEDARYDVLLSHNSINHLDEEAASRLHTDGEARRRYLNIALLLARLTRPGGDLVVADCARWNLFGLLGLPNPFAPTIAWRIHQQPSTWVRILTESGFTKARVRWNAMSRTGRVGEVVLGNWLGGFMTRSHFRLHMRRAS